MANELNITISLTDRISNQVKSTADSLEKFSQAAKHVGRELSQIGSTVSLLGGAISGPFVLALANSAKNSAAVSEQMTRLHSITNQFQATIAEAVLPIVERFNNILNGLLTAFNSLAPGMRTMILQGAFLAGIFLTMGGTITFVIGKIVSLTANVAGLLSTFSKFALANLPLLAIAASIGILIFLMFKFKGVADFVLSAFEILFKFLENGFLTINATFEGFIAVTLEGLAMLTGALAKIPGPTQKAFQDMTNQIKGAADVARRMADNDLRAIAENTEAIGRIMTTGEGEWSKILDEMKNKIESAGNAVEEMGNKSADAFKKLSVEEAEGKLKLIAESQKELDTLFKAGTITAQEYYQGIIQAQDQVTFRNNIAAEQLRQLADITREVNDRELLSAEAKTQGQIKLLNFYKQEFMLAHQGMTAFVTTVAQNMQTGLSGAITNIITGVKSAKEAFTEFGKAMITAIVQFIAQKLVAAAIEKVLLATTVRASTTAADAIAKAWARAAAMVSLATMGGNAIPAAAAIIGVTTLASTIATIGSAASKIQGAAAMAEGGQGIVTRPTLFLAGEAGPERFSFTPIGSGNKGNGGGPIEVNIYIQSANLSSGQDIAMVAEELGIKTARSLKTARGI